MTFIEIKVYGIGKGKKNQQMELNNSGSSKLDAVKSPPLSREGCLETLDAFIFD